MIRFRLGCSETTCPQQCKARGAQNPSGRTLRLILDTLPARPHVYNHHDKLYIQTLRYECVYMQISISWPCFTVLTVQKMGDGVSLQVVQRPWSLCFASVEWKGHAGLSCSWLIGNNGR